ncbi:MAG TPA: AI-2E family transporter [Firmicutes bacterium]|nr:AI-2E family transporter [Bacillota bacterium]
MKIEWKNCFRVGVSAFLLYLCIHYWGAVSGFLGAFLSALLPLITGFAIAYIVNILMSFYERHYFRRHSGSRIVRKTRRTVCLIAAVLTLCGFGALIIMCVIPELISCVQFLIAAVAPALEKLLESEFVSDHLPSEIYKALADVNWEQLVSRVVQFVVSGIGNTARALVTAISSVVSVVATTFISIIFSIYLLYSKEKLQKQCRRLLDTYIPKGQRQVSYVASVLDDCFHRYIVGQCTEAVILGVLCTVGMLIFRFPYAPMIGALIGFTALIPVAGAYIGAAVGAIMILTVSPLKALLFLVFIVVLQQLEGNLIYPKVVGKSIGLPAIWVLAAITVGGSLMGIAGMLISVPITAALYRLLKEDMRRQGLKKLIARRKKAGMAKQEKEAEEKSTEEI